VVSEVDRIVKWVCPLLGERVSGDGAFSSRRRAGEGFLPFANHLVLLKLRSQSVDTCGKLPHIRYVGEVSSMSHNQILQIRRQSRKQERLEARLTRDQKRLIERAAQIRGTSVTDFVLASARRAATETIEEFQRLRLRDEAREVFVNALLNPPAPNAPARAAAQRYKERMGL